MVSFAVVAIHDLVIARGEYLYRRQRRRKRYLGLGDGVLPKPANENHQSDDTSGRN